MIILNYFMEQLPLIKELPPTIKTVLYSIRERLEGLTLPKGFRAFGRVSKTGLYEMGVEHIDGNPERTTIVGIPGLAHDANSYIQQIELLGSRGIQITAVSPPGEMFSKIYRRGRCSGGPV